MMSVKALASVLCLILTSATNLSTNKHCALPPQEPMAPTPIQSPSQQVVPTTALSTPKSLVRPIINKTSSDGINLIQQFEGYSPFRYKDSAGLDTIGFGHLIKPGERFSEPFLTTDALALLVKDLEATESGLNKSIKGYVKQSQYDALASFAFNVGITATKNSTLLKKVNANQHTEVPPQFLRWANAGGKFVKGLYVRRKLEAALYKTASN